jgi:hypothetical protein
MTEERRKESIRAWYERTTRRARKAIVLATFASLGIMGVMWLTASLPLLQRVQTWNGALTVPLLGGVWIMSFIYMFLVPSREASFRGQESIERTVEILDNAIERKISPAMEIWRRLGERIENEIKSGLLEEVKQAIKEMKDVAEKVQNGNVELRKLAADAKPVVEKLRSLQERIEKQIAAGLLDDIQDGAKAMKSLGVPPVDAEYDISKTLSLIQKKKPVSQG